MPVSASVRTRNRTNSARARVPPRGTAVAAAALCAVLAATGCSESDDASSIVRTTTNIAGASVLGLERDTTRACALPTAPDPAGDSTRAITHLAGTSEVPADPQRIVVLTTSALDATCAVGLWERVVGAVTLDGPTPQPAYLGIGVDLIPSVGTAVEPDPARIAGLRPDLIIGAIPTGAASFDTLQAIAPTVFVDAANRWQDEFTTTAAALGRRNAAAAALDNYRVEARDTGNGVFANQTQASVIRFTGDSIQIQGNDSFAGQVLADAGVQRPAAQRGASYDVSTEDLDTKVEGDLIYVIFADDASKRYGQKVMRTEEWKDLGAASDHRVFAPEDSVWHATGLTAARAMLTDIRATLNGYVTD